MATSNEFIKKSNIFPLAIFFIFFISYFFTIKNYEISLTKYVLIENLINYEGGFVRRGFLGNIIYYLNLVTDLDPKKIISSIFLVTYSILLILFYKISKKLWIYNAPLYIFIVLNPSTVSFPLFDFNALFRKEVFFYIVYFYHILIAQRALSGFLSIENYKRQNLYFIIPALFINMFIHELQFFLIPFHILINIAVLKNKISKRFLYNYLIFVFLFFLFTFPADIETVKLINISLEKFLPNISNEYTAVTILSGNINLQLGQTLWFLSNSNLSHFVQIILVILFTIPLFTYLFIRKLFNFLIENEFYKKLIFYFNLYLYLLLGLLIILSFDTGRLLNILIFHLIGFYLIFSFKNYTPSVKSYFKKIILKIFIVIFVIFFYLPSGPIFAGKGTIFEKVHNSIFILFK